MRRERVMYHHILAPMDGSELAESVLPHLKSVVTGCRPARVTLLRVVEHLDIPSTTGDYLDPEDLVRIQALHRSSAERYLTDLANRLIYDGIRAESATVMADTPAAGIAEYAAKNGVDLVVMASHGRSGLSRWVWGSTAGEVLSLSGSPVLIVRAPGCGPQVYRLDFRSQD